MADETDKSTKPQQCGEWYEINAAWNAEDYASTKLMKLGETLEWLELVNEASQRTRATADEIWDGMAAALRGYLESLDELKVVNPHGSRFNPKEACDG